MLQIPIILFLFFLHSDGYTQDTQGRYRRKSISFVEAILPQGEARLTDRQQSLLLSEIQSELEMPRFDYNPLPEELTRNFRQELQGGISRDIESVSEVINRVLVPEIVSVLDYEKEMRARGLVSEVERHSFIVDKAKETGITEADLRAIMNSAYLYLPVLNQTNVSIDKENRSASVSLTGGILWFRVVHSESSAAVTLLAKKTAVGYAWGRWDNHDHRNGWNPGDIQSTFTSAAETFAKNLKIATQEIPDFQLTNPLTQTGAGWVEFSLGKDEGVGVDDKYMVAEYQLQPDSSLKRIKLGMVRVTRVGKSSDGLNDSHATTVIGSGFQPGMVAMEHPRLPIDISFRLARLPIQVSAGIVDRYTANGLNALEFDEDMRTSIYAGQLWLNYNLARPTGWPQFFASMYGEIGGGKLSGGKAYGESLPIGFYWGVGAGLSKKYHLNRFHLGMEALLSYSRYQMDGKTAIAGNQIEWKWANQNVGLTLNGNLEIALGYDVNLGGGISYRAFNYNGDWEHSSNGGEYTPLPNNPGIPSLSFAGMGYQIYFTWSLPALGVDPVKVLGGILGK